MRKIFLLFSITVLLTGCTSINQTEYIEQPEEVSTEVRIEWRQRTSEEDLNQIDRILLETHKAEINSNNLTTVEPQLEEINTECVLENINNSQEVIETTYSERVTAYEITAYTWTGNQMANGEYPYYGVCACNSLPMGTVVEIEGLGRFVVCDRGGMSDDVIDVYMDSYDECIEWGRQVRTVTIIEER